MISLILLNITQIFADYTKVFSAIKSQYDLYKLRTGVDNLIH